jgi:DNA-binding response OmpR family regulator
MVDPAEKRDGMAPEIRRVLIVDDYPNAAERLASYLRRFGNEVRVAFGGFEGIAVAKEFRPDIIFLDTDMPNLDGYETAKRLREQRWGKKMMLIALTGWVSEKYRKLGREAGFDAHLVKSLAHSELSVLLVSFGSSLSETVNPDSLRV